MPEHTPDQDDRRDEPDPYELAQHPEEMDDGPPPAVPSTPSPAPADPPASATPGSEKTTQAKTPTPTPTSPLRCPHCDKDITGPMLAGNCPHCGKKVADPTPSDEQSSAHALTALVLGILSVPMGLTCLGLLGTILGSVLGAILGALAVHFARLAIRDIEGGHAPPTSEGTARIGRICGIVGVVVGCALTLFYAALQLIAFALDF